MQNATPIQFRQVRDLGQLISTTFTFLRANWRPLYRTIAAICLPVTLAGGFLIGGSFTTIQRASVAAATDVGAIAGGGLLMLLGYLLLLAGFLLLAAIVHEYLRAYHLGEHIGITVGGLWRRAISQFLSYFGIMFLTGLVTIVVAGVCYIPLVIGATSGQMGATIGLVFLSFLLVPIVVLYLTTVFSLTMPAHAIERTGAWRALGRSMNLVKGGFWPTLGLLIVIGLIVYMVVMAVFVVVYLVGIVIVLVSMPEVFDGSGEVADRSSWIGILMGIVMTAVSCMAILVQPVMYVCMGLKYFSRVEEKEARGLQDRIAGFEQA